MRFLVLCGLLSAMSGWAQLRGEVIRDQSPLRKAPRPDSKVLGRLMKSTPVVVIARSGGQGSSGDSRFVQIEARDQEGRVYVGFVEARHLKMEELAPVSVPVDETLWDPVDRPWSASLGAAGSSTEGQSTLTVSGELRYLWTAWTETLVGLDLFLGESPSLGGAVGQRIYSTLWERFRPFGQGGLRSDSFRNWESRAGILGGGLQVLWSPSTYFEVSVLRYFRPEGRPDQWVFGGSSGLRF